MLNENAYLGTLPSEGFNDGIATNKSGENSFGMVSSKFTGEILFEG